VAKGGGLKAFFGSMPGRLVLLAAAVLTLAGCFLLGPSGQFIAIPDLLLFGLVAPIYSGWKRPRHLAVTGFVTILLATPVAAAIAIDYAYQPSPATDSAVLSGTSVPLLHGAIASPYAGGAGATYNFSVTVDPQGVPANDSSPLWVVLFVSTCPGATSTNDPYCSAGYPYLEYNQTLPANLSSPLLVSFVFPINGTNIWSWQMATAYHAPAANQNLSWVFLDIYAVQGPIVGPYPEIFALGMEAYFLSLLLGPGLVFYFGLLIYMFFKRREARRKAGAAPRPPAGPAGSTEPSRASPGSPAIVERTCSKCQAVVYPNESACWKCGTPLTPPRSESPPLPSG
jgi:hypothetical protein